MKIYIYRTGTIGLLTLFIISLLIAALISGWTIGRSDKPISTIDSETLNSITKDNKARLRIAITPSTDFIGGLIANGGLETAENSLYSKKHSLSVSFKIVEDFSRCIALLHNKEVDVIWATPGLLALYSGELTSANAVAFLQYSWSRGEDILLVKKGIRALPDLSGGQLASSRGSSAQFLAYYLIRQSGLQPDSINIQSTHTDADALTLFLNGKVDACAISFAEFDKRDLKGDAYSIFSSTRDASRLITGIFVTRESFIVLYKDILKKLSIGWFEAVSSSMSNPDDMVEKVAGYLRCSDKDIRQSLGRKAIATFSDNCRFFRLKGNERVGFNELYETSVSLCNITGRNAHIRSASMVKNTGIIVSLLNEKLIRYQKTVGGKTFLNRQLTGTQFMHAELSTNFPVLFGKNSVDITFEASNKLREIAFAASIFGTADIYVRGFADHKGETAAEYLKSSRRERVMRYLISEFDVPLYRFKVDTGAKRIARDLEHKSKVDFQFISSGK